MWSPKLLSLAVLCAVCISQAIQIEAAQVASTTVFWSGDNCSGHVKNVITGNPEGCTTLFSGRSTLHTCNNDTGVVSSTYAGPKCTGELLDVSTYGVNQCSLDIAGPIARFCGKVTSPPSLPNKPIPKPVAGAGTVYNDLLSCDYLGGGCPSGSPITLRYYGKDCTGTVTANILYTGLTPGPCFALVDPQGMKYNIQATVSAGYISINTYQSGCDGNPIYSSTSLLGKCLNTGDSSIISVIIPK